MPRLRMLHRDEHVVLSCVLGWSSTEATYLRLDSDCCFFKINPSLLSDEQRMILAIVILILILYGSPVIEEADCASNEGCTYSLESIRVWTAEGSANVDVSPIESSSLCAILRRIRRMILPERVFGSTGAQWITSGVANAPISDLTCTHSQHQRCKHA